jgi:arylsulfatase A-like enzyme
MVLVLLATGGALAQRGSKKRPNIVFIIADDMGWADVGYHGSEIQTPHIDGLAKNGVTFDQHYAMPTCTPTRVGLMTGRFPSRCGVLSPAYGQIFDADTVTLGTALGAAGYDTSISGKWHMGSPPDCVPRKYGFRTSYGYFDGQIDPYTHLYKTGRRCWHRNDELVDEEGHATDLISDEAVRVIETKRDTPFFLYVAYSVPHHPLNEPEKWTSVYSGIIEEESRRWFAAGITHMDAGIGRILDALDRTGQRENTLVVFVSDNGGQKQYINDKEYFGRYADKPHTVLGNNLPLRGWKGDVYEGGIRVPALANWPGVLKPGKVTAPVHIADWMPTFCELAGHTPARDLQWDGRTIWPLITREVTKPEARSLYWKTPEAYAVRQGDWKLLVNQDGMETQLFDLAADPCETRDLAGEQPEQVAQLKRLLEKYQAGDRELVGS